MAALAAHRCRLYICGNTATSVTGANTPMTNIDSGANLQWQLGASTNHQIWEPSASLAFQGNVGPTTVVPDVIDYLFGTITFAAATTSVEIDDYSYWTMYEVGTVTDYTISLSGDVLDTSTIDVDTYRNKLVGLIDMSGSLSLLESPYEDYDNTQTDNSFGEILRGKQAKILEITMPDSTLAFRAWINVESYENTGTVDGLVESSVSFVGSPQMAAETGVTSGSAYSLGDVGSA